MNKLMTHLGINKKSDFAKFLGIAPSTLSSWYARNTFNLDLIYSKCEELSLSWLLTGEGEMLKEDNVKQDENEIEVTPKKNDTINENKLLQDIIEAKEETIEYLKKNIELLISENARLKEITVKSI